MRTAVVTLAALIITSFPLQTVAAQGKAASPPLVEKYLVTGKLADGEAALLAHLKENPKDDQARFGLGVLQVLRGAERLVQSFHKFGVRSDGLRELFGPRDGLPFLANPNPQPISYADARKIVQALLDDLQKAEATLAQVAAEDVKLPVKVGLIFLDFNGDGRSADEECFWRIYDRLNPGAGVNADNAEKFVVTFDRADVHWLRAYCHFLMGFTEFALAHDWKELFERTAHLIFAKVDSPYPFLKPNPNPGGFFGPDFLDIIAFIHLNRFPVKEPKRMASALAHLEAVIAQGKQSWKFLLAETDNDNEWIPNPKQTGVIPNVQITQEMVLAWTIGLEEAQAIIEGKKLVPFWRDADGKGVNLRKAFLEPREFDLVLWVQGTAAAPYLEKGDVTSKEVWFKLLNAFGPRLFGFVIWFN